VFDATIRENLMSAISSVSDVSKISVIARNEHASVTNTETIQVSERQGTDCFVPRDDELQEQESTKTQQEEQLIQALRLAQCDFVFELENGLDTEIGER
jgi:ABC-type multidrug transport system fused ATPase/permease subunit